MIILDFKLEALSEYWHMDRTQAEHNGLTESEERVVGVQGD